MRNIRKPGLSLAAGIAGAALLLTACGGDDSTKDDNAQSTTQGSGPVTLTLATFNEFGYEGLVEEYQKLHPNVTIKHRKAATSNEARDNMNTRLAAGGSGLADIEAIEVDWLPELMQYPDRFADLKSADVEGRWLDWKVKQATTSDGKLLGYGTDIGPEAVCYRSDLFKKAGLPTDREAVASLIGTTWESYFQAGEKFVANSDAAWFDSAGATYQGMVNQLAAAYEKPDGTPVPLGENAQVKQLYDTVLQAAVDRKLSAGLSQWSEDWTNAFQKSRFATMLCPGWMLGVIEGNAAKVKGWDIADTFPGGGGNWGGSFLTVPAKGKNVEEAKKLAAWLTAPEQQMKAFAAKGTFPSQVKALQSTELAGKVNAFFNDAPTGKILANRAAAVTVTPFKGPNYFAIHQTVADAITRVDTDKSDDAASSWKKAVQAYQELGLS